MVLYEATTLVMQKVTHTLIVVDELLSVSI